MKLIKYTLTPEGTIPEYVVDGGYLAVANSGASPQDLDLVGVAKMMLQQEGFANKAALLPMLKVRALSLKIQ
jgi:hypothetical protein